MLFLFFYKIKRLMDHHIY